MDCEQCRTYKAMIISLEDQLKWAHKNEKQYKDATGDALQRLNEEKLRIKWVTRWILDNEIGPGKHFLEDERLSRIKIMDMKVRYYLAGDRVIPYVPATWLETFLRYIPKEDMPKLKEFFDNKWWGNSLEAEK